MSSSKEISMPTIHSQESDPEVAMSMRQADLDLEQKRMMRRVGFGVLVGVLSIGTLYAALRMSPAGSNFDSVESTYQTLGNRSEETYFKPLDGAKKEAMETVDYGGYEIILRSGASSGSKELGITKPGIEVEAQLGIGKVQPGGDNLWYELGMVPVYDKVGDEYFPRFDKYGKPVMKHAYVAAHFLQKPEDSAGLQPSESKK